MKPAPNTGPLIRWRFLIPFLVVLIVLLSWDEIRILRLSHQLKDKDVMVRESAAGALGQLGPHAKRAVPALLEAVKDDDADVRNLALAALARTGAPSNQLRSALLVALRKSTPNPRILASPRLVQTAVPALLEQLKDQDKWDGGMALGQIGQPAVPGLIAMLNGKDSRARARAAQALEWLPSTNAQAVAALAQALQDEDASVRASAAQALRRQGELGRSALKESSSGKYPALLHADLLAVDFIQFDNGFVFIRYGAENFPAPPLETSEAIPRLAQELGAEDANLRRRAANALGRMRPPAIPTLIESFRNSPDRLAFEAINAFQFIGKSGVPPLIAALQDTNVIVRRSAAMALAVIGPQAAEAIPALVAQLHDKSDKATRSCAAVALGHLGKPAIPALIAALKDDDEDLSLNGGKGLKDAGRDAEFVLPELIAALKDPRAHIRFSAVYALGGQPSASQAAPLLAEFLKNEPSWNRRFYASFALARISPKSDEAWPVLIEALKHQENNTRVRARVMLQKMPLPSDETIAALIQELSDKNAGSGVRTILRNFGKGAVPALEKALKDPDLEVRREAGAILLEINPESLNSKR